MRFEDLGLIAPLLRALQDVGYQSPSPIQEEAIPPVLNRRDLLGCAQTGTGKTAAFALPLLQLLEQDPAPVQGRRIRVLVLTPTRELAAQIQECFENYGKYLHHRSVVIFGGVGQQPQVEALRKGTDILVATPGRLLDLCGQGIVKLKDLKYFVLDEADRMLDMGFIHDIRRVIKLLPAKRQTLFFSATMPEEIRRLAAGLLTDPVEVAVTPVSSTVDTIRQKVLFTDKSNKRELLLWLLQSDSVTSALVFTRTKHLADRVARHLKKNGLPADSIHGDKSQGARLRALGDFKSGKCRVLVATDIAARGIDVSGISHVFNFDLPDVPETYVHRIGRTGRAGHEGTAVSFCTPDDVSNLRGIEKLIRKPVPVMAEHPYPCSEEIASVAESGLSSQTQKLEKAKEGLNKLQKKNEPDQKKQPEKKRKSADRGIQKEKAPSRGSEEKAEHKKIDLDFFRSENRTEVPLPSKIFSSDVRLPGRVAARSDPRSNPNKPDRKPKQKKKSASKTKTPPLEQLGSASAKNMPSSSAETLSQKDTDGKQKRISEQKEGKKPQPNHTEKKETFLAVEPREGEQQTRASSRSRHRREPVWIPMNDQPIVTRPQSYFLEPAQKEEREETVKDRKPRKKRRRKPKSNTKTPGGTP